MAFGDLLGTLSGTTTSVTNPFSTSTGSATVSVNDLIVVLASERTDNTTTTITDNLGNTYTAQNAGSDAGNACGRAYYSFVSVSGTLNTVTAATTASSNDYSLVAAALAGPFIRSIDANPANITNDTTTPYTCPASGTLAQAVEVVIGWLAATNGRDATASSPNLLAVSAKSAAEGAANSVSGAIGYQVTAATTSVAPAFTFAGGSITASVLGTMSFKQDTSPPIVPLTWPIPVVAQQPISSRTWTDFGRALTTPVVQVPFSQSYWPIPVLPQQPIGSRTWIQTPVSSQPSDTVNMPCMVTDWLAPVGPAYSVNLRTWIGPKTQDVAFVQPPLNVPAWPLPRLAPPVGLTIAVAGNALATAAAAGKPFQQSDWPTLKSVPVIGQTIAFAGNALTTVPAGKPFSQSSWPIPVLPQQPIGSRTWIQTPVSSQPSDTVNMPCMVTDWLAPVGPLYSVDLRTWITPKTKEVSFVQPPLNTPEWPLPRRAPPVGLTVAVAGNALAAAAAAGKPFQQADWPLPKLVRPSGLTISVAGNALPAAAAAGKPFQQSDWPLPKLIRPVGLTVSVAGNALSTAAAAGKPFQQSDWPLPRIAQYPVSLRTFIADATELLATVETVFRGPLYTRVPAPPQPQPFIAPNTLLTTLAPQQPKPSANYDWPRQQASPFPPAFITQDLLLTTLAVPPDTTNMPCVAVDWMPATSWQLRAQAAQGSPLSLLTATPAPKPFSQADWPNPIQSRSVRTDVLGSSPLLTEFNVKPFQQSEWPVPIPAPPIGKTIAVAGNALPNAAAAGQPFQQSDWPLPKVLPPVGKTISFAGNALAFAAATGKPFAQNEWPLPKLAVGLPAEIRSAYLPLATAAAAGKPFLQSEWPLPRRSKSNDADSYPSYLPLLNAPVVTPPEIHNLPFLVTMGRLRTH